MGVVQDIQNDLDIGAIRLVAEYRDLLFAEAVRLCGDPDQAEDLAVRTLERAIRRIDQFEASRGRLLDWLKGILTNFHRMDLRKKASQVEVATAPDEFDDLVQETDMSAVEEIFKKSDEEMLHRALRSLPIPFRKVIVFHYLMDFPVTEIARILRCEVGTVKSRLHRGWHLLFERLKPLLKGGTLVGILVGVSAVLATVLTVTRMTSAGSDERKGEFRADMSGARAACFSVSDGRMNAVCRGRGDSYDSAAVTAERNETMRQRTGPVLTGMTLAGVLAGAPMVILGDTGCIISGSTQSIPDCVSASAGVDLDTRGRTASGADGMIDSRFRTSATSAGMVTMNGFFLIFR